MRSIKKYIFLAAVVVLVTAGITGCGWWKNASEQTKKDAELSATQDTGNDAGEKKDAVAADMSTKKPSVDDSNNGGGISEPEVLIDQDSAARNENIGTGNTAGNQNGNKPEQTNPDRQDHNGNGNNNQNNTGSDNHGRTGNNDSNNQGNNGNNAGSGDQGNNGGNTGTGDIGENNQPVTGDHNDQPGNGGSQPVELPEIPIN